MVGQEEIYKASPTFSFEHHPTVVVSILSNVKLAHLVSQSLEDLALGRLEEVKAPEQNPLYYFILELNKLTIATPLGPGHPVYLSGAKGKTLRAWRPCWVQTHYLGI